MQFHQDTHANWTALEHQFYFPTWLAKTIVRQCEICQPCKLDLYLVILTLEGPNKMVVVHLHKVLVKYAMSIILLILSLAFSGTQNYGMRRKNIWRKQWMLWVHLKNLKLTTRPGVCCYVVSGWRTRAPSGAAVWMKGGIVSLGFLQGAWEKSILVSGLLSLFYSNRHGRNEDILETFPLLPDGGNDGPQELAIFPGISS